MRPVPNGGGLRANDAERMMGVLLGGLVLLVILATGLWWRFHAEIARALLGEQHLTLRALSLVTHRYDALRFSLEEAAPERVTALKLWQLCSITGSVLRWPIALLIVGLAVLCVLRAPREQYRARFGLDGLQKILARIHPIGHAWIGNDAVLVAPAPPGEALRPLDPALRVEEWIDRYCRTGTVQQRVSAAEAALGKQLGAPWSGPHAATPLIQCLFVAFAWQADRRKKDAVGLLGDLSTALSGQFQKKAPSKPAAIPQALCRSVRLHLERGDWSKAVEITNRHAYTVPALLSLLQYARVRTGVFNPGLFACIQLVDRDLWLALSAVSYPRDGLPNHIISTASCLEASGALEHWRAECEEGSPLSRKHIERSVEALNIL